ncbi:sulfurtransferase [Sulfurifustis variabilis]|uniref:Sulfurtransferase n=1 Tax=Sulfurifustis variabilis TaxID=1675686 RepID=A0A1B4V0L4_9GAMM|nr:rhodanese-like domain-containing protein [Sulfurifustis variabilis]BAU47000.1 sulfurtransferase [Sulfurifustis variabilis]
MQFVINNWYLFLALAVILAMLIGPTLSQRRYGIKSVNPAEAILLINREAAVVVDVCEPNEYAAGHIPGALSVPLSGFEKHLKPLEKHRKKPVVVACRSGNRSLRGAVTLRKQGFEKVYSLAGGLVAWQRDNLPLEK